MEDFSLVTPTFLFSAISLIMLAYTNRFLSYAQLVRTLKEHYLQSRSEVTAAQIRNLKKRLYLTRNMQVLGISSLFFCVISMFLIYIGYRTASIYVFGFSLLLLVASLGVSIAEILISVRARKSPSFGLMQALSHRPAVSCHPLTILLSSSSRTSFRYAIRFKNRGFFKPNLL